MRRFIYKWGFYLAKFYWFVFRPDGFGIKCIVVDHLGRFLVIKNTYGQGVWTFPGGSIKKGERAEKAAVREVMEETGVRTKNVRHIGSFVSTQEYKRDHVEVFAAEAETTEILIDPGEIKEAQWLDPRESLKTLSKLAHQCLEFYPGERP